LGFNANDGKQYSCHLLPSSSPNNDICVRNRLLVTAKKASSSSRLVAAAQQQQQLEPQRLLALGILDTAHVQWLPLLWP
jgi:hypothetical protein